MPESPHSVRMVDRMIRQPVVPGQRILKGIPASAGIAIARAVVLSVEAPSLTPERISGERIEADIQRFLGALETASRELMNAIDLARNESATVSSIIESFLMIVSDPTITRSIIQRIEQGVAAETAVIAEFDVHKSALYQARDAILRERAQDFEHVKERLLAMLRNRQLSHEEARNGIVVAGSVTPQDMLFFKQTGTLAYVTEIGGINAHACILARDMGIPAVIGIRNATMEVRSGATIIVDGYAGQVVVDPDERTLADYHERVQRIEEYRQRLGALITLPSETLDGTTVQLMANVDTPDHVAAALVQGAAGVGLVRTEFLLIQRGRYPGLDEQVEWYRDIAQRAFPLPVTFRAFDVGSDKFREGIPHHEDNPALGLRGIRFLLYRPDIFQQQIMAVLQASSHKNVRFMLPMVSVPEELAQARAMIEACKVSLRERNIDFDPAMPVGVMVETPAAALMADTFARSADFLSIGTNDLAQYALATDRTNEMVADIFDAMHPAVVRLIAMVVAAARRNGTPVSVCGELAGHAAATEMLVGLGIRELSVAPSLILEVKQRIRAATASCCEDLATKVQDCSSTSDVYAVLAGSR